MDEQNQTPGNGDCPTGCNSKPHPERPRLSPGSPPCFHPERLHNSGLSSTHTLELGAPAWAMEVGYLWGFFSFICESRANSASFMDS